ncbi:MAG: hypothetical protein LC798_12150 [Chloroflexi bacterium]|nr:hypothetical protein [Chloroflexota bacterium]
MFDNAGKPARVTGRWPIKRECIGPPACLVMHRWTLLRVRGRKLVLHHFLPGSEDMSVHDHPAPFWTFVLWGGYDDIGLCPDCADRPMRGLCHLRCATNPACGMGDCGCRCGGTGEVAGDRMSAGMLRRREASHAHRTRTLPSGAWTIVLMGRKTRPWGFWTRGRWWPWAEHEKAFGMGMRCPTDGEG